MEKMFFFCFRQLKVRAMAELILPDPAAGRTGRQLGVCRGLGNFLLLHVKKSKAEQQRLGGGSGEESKVHEVRWETTLYEPVFRKLVKKSLGIFLSLQKLAEAGVVSDQLVRRTILKNMKSQMHSCDNWSGLQVRVSLRYRSAIKDCQEQLEHLAETGAAAQSSHYLAQVYRFTFIVASFYKSIAVGVDVQAIVDLAPCGDPVHGQQPGGARHAPPS